MKNDFARLNGSEILNKPLVVTSLLTTMIILGYLIAGKGWMAGIGIIMLPFVFTYIYFIFLIPRTGIIGLYLINFVILGSMRYIKGLPLGLMVDFHLVLIYLALFFKTFSNPVPWKNARNDLTLLAAIWFLYSLFQLANPEAVSRSAWFYAMRGVSLYMLLTIPVIFIAFNRVKDLNVFFRIWAVLSILGTIKGIMQKFIGPDSWEQAWLDGGGELTHVLSGGLRIFSFFSDAGQFGAAQGHAGVVFLILAINQKKSGKLRWLYGIAGAMGMYGMMISGTRGAIAVPAAGFFLYIMLQRKIRIILAGVILGLSVFVFFKYTNIGNGNYTINRMRTAFDPDNKSLQIRLENQKHLKAYLADRPFGGGLGSAGNWGKRFAPNTFLASIPTDSWYVMIWAEQGIVGLILHLFILFYIVVKSSFIIVFRLRNPGIKAQMCALVSGMFGIMAASYGNGVLGQMPTGIILYSSMAFLFLARHFEIEMARTNSGQSNPGQLLNPYSP